MLNLFYLKSFLNNFFFLYLYNDKGELELVALVLNGFCCRFRLVKRMKEHWIDLFKGIVCGTTKSSEKFVNDTSNYKYIYLISLQCGHSRRFIYTHSQSRKREVIALYTRIKRGVAEGGTYSTQKKRREKFHSLVWLGSKNRWWVTLAYQSFNPSKFDRNRGNKHFSLSISSS